METLILCPLNLVPRWEDYCHQYRLPSARVLSYSKVIQLPELPRYRLLILDESHNLRNREGRVYKTIIDYIQKNDGKCILLSATPYNKDYLDLANQLRLFVPSDEDLGVAPQQAIHQYGGELRFIEQCQCKPRTLAAFEKSSYPDDWRELMRLFMVRRTRGFIKGNYAETDETNGRKYLPLADGVRSYFPDRLPKTVPFRVNENDPDDQYAKLYAPDIVDLINQLDLPRYGLGNFVLQKLTTLYTAEEDAILDDLSHAGTHLMDFCRTNLFKRLESSGYAFLLSVQPHILRDFIFLHAIKNGLPLPVGTGSLDALDTRYSDMDENNLLDEDDRAPVSPSARKPIFADAPPNFTTSTRKSAAAVSNGFAPCFLSPS